MPIVINAASQGSPGPFPAPYVVEVLPYSADAETDDYGNPVEGYGDPVEAAVYGWAPGGSQELTGWQSQVTADLSLYAPSGFPATHRDRVRVDGVVYDVTGVPEDFNHGPFGFAPGIRVNLTRVEG